MVQNHTLCFVIADGGHARFVFPAEDHALHTQESLDSIAATKQDSDLVSDRPGRSFESASPARHAYTPKTDPHELEKTRFARTVAEKLRALSAQGAFDKVVLVAPATVLEQISKGLDTATVAKVTATIAKDLVGVPDHELQPHLEPWARPVHRRAG
jgi:protein required for attachment to host cells